MSWCPDLLEVITIDGQRGTVVELFGSPCKGFMVEFGNGDFRTYDEYGTPVPSRRLSVAREKENT